MLWTSVLVSFYYHFDLFPQQDHIRYCGIYSPDYCYCGHSYVPRCWGNITGTGPCVRCSKGSMFLGSTCVLPGSYVPQLNSSTKWEPGRITHQRGVLPYGSQYNRPTLEGTSNVSHGITKGHYLLVFLLTQICHIMNECDIWIMNE